MWASYEGIHIPLLSSDGPIEAALLVVGGEFEYIIPLLSSDGPIEATVERPGQASLSHIPLLSSDGPIEARATGNAPRRSTICIPLLSSDGPIEAAGSATPDVDIVGHSVAFERRPH